MGITGTDVAKGAADMTLTDDNFATIVDAVKEGRGIYANIRKVVGFLLGTNIGEIVLVFLAMVIWQQTPLLSMQLLWINLVTDSLPAIALGMEPIENDIMKQKPKPKNEGIFARGLGVRVVLQGLMFGLLSLFAFRLGFVLTNSETVGRTMAFMTLALSQVLHAYNMRSHKSLFSSNPFANSKLNWSCLGSLLLVAIVLFTPLNTVFGLEYLTWQNYLICLGLGFMPIVVMELAKLFKLVKN
jgi:Ca2+-transporting ATPase